MGGTMKLRSSMKKFSFIVFFIVLAGALAPLVRSEAVIYDFVEKASAARWMRLPGTAEALPFNGGPSDKRGFVLYLTNAVLEDGITYANVLETHPEWKDGGRIYGDFTDVKIPAGAKLTAKVGFMKGATKSDGVEFQAFMIDPTTNMGTKLLIHEAGYDGKLDDISVDLSAYAGKTQTIRLAVYAKSSAQQDWAAWAEVKMTGPMMVVGTIAPGAAQVIQKTTVQKALPVAQTPQATAQKTPAAQKTPLTTAKLMTPMKFHPIVLEPIGTPPPKHEIDDLGSLSVIEPLTISDHLYKDNKKPNTYYFIPKEINLIRGRTPGSYKIAAVWTKDQKVKTTLSMQANIDPSDVKIMNEAVKAKYGSGAVLRSIPYDSANIIDLEGWGDWQIENIRIPSFGSLEGEIPINITMTPETLAELKPLLEKEGLTAGMHIKSGEIEKEIPMKVGLRYFVGRYYSPLDELNFSYGLNSLLTLHGVKNFSDFPLAINSVNLRFKFPNKEEIYKGLPCEPPVTIPPGGSADVKVKLIPQPALQAEISKLGPPPKEKEKSLLDNVLEILGDKAKEKMTEKAKEEAKKKGDVEIPEEEKTASVNIDPKWNNFFKSSIKSYWMDVTPEFENQEALNKVWGNIEVCSYIDRMRKINIEALDNVFDPVSYETPIEVSKIHLEIKTRYLTAQPKDGLTSADLSKDKLKESIVVYLPMSEQETFEFNYKIKVIKKSGESVESADWIHVADSLDVTIGTSQITALFQQ